MGCDDNQLATKAEFGLNRTVLLLPLLFLLIMRLCSALLCPLHDIAARQI